MCHYRVVRSWAEEMEAEDERKAEMETKSKNEELKLVQEGNEADETTSDRLVSEDKVLGRKFGFIID